MNRGLRDQVGRQELFLNQYSAKGVQEHFSRGSSGIDSLEEINCQMLDLNLYFFLPKNRPVLHISQRFFTPAILLPLYKKNCMPLTHPEAHKGESLQGTTPLLPESP